MINIKVFDEKGNKTEIQIKAKGINEKELLEIIKKKTLIKIPENGAQIIDIKKDKVIKGDIQLSDGDEIKIKNTKGNEAIIFGDITKDKIINLIAEQDSSIPEYLGVMPGLNIFGKCDNEKCDLCNQPVIAIPIEKEEYDAVKEEFLVKCRKCKCTIKGKTIAFYRCFYNYYGIKYLENENENKIEPFGEEIKDFQFIEIPSDLKININGKSYTIHKAEDISIYEEDIEKVNFIKLKFQVHKW